MELEKVLSSINTYLKDKDGQLQFFVPGIDDVPVSGTKFSNMDILTLVEAAMSGWITEGKYSQSFARKLCKFTKIHHAVLCNSGSSANLLAMEAMKETYKVPYHSLVVTSALAFPTTVAPILQAGFIPQFVDVDYRTLNPDPYTLISLASDPGVRGLIISHTLGFPLDLREVAKEYHDRNKFVIEDCCDALGSNVGDDHVGQSGDVATLSFFPAHHLSTGEGGAVLTNNGRLMRIIESYSNWGRDCWCKPGENNTCGKRFDYKFDNLPDHFDHKYVWARPGYNMKMTDLQAALGSSQMNKIYEITTRRKNNYYFLLHGFEQMKGFYDVFGTIENPFSFSPFGFPINCLKVDRSKIIAFLEDRKIRTRPVFSGNITRHPMMQPVNYVTKGGLNGADFVMENTFWIGCHPELKTEQLVYVLDTFEEFLKTL